MTRQSYMREILYKQGLQEWGELEPKEQELLNNQKNEPVKELINRQSTQN